MASFAASSNPLRDVIEWLGRATFDFASEQGEEKEEKRERVEEQERGLGHSKRESLESILLGSPLLGSAKARSKTTSPPLLASRISTVVEEEAQDVACCMPSGRRRRRHSGPSFGLEGERQDACRTDRSIAPQSEEIDSEEAQWATRQRQTGATGRLVTYNSVFDRPREDISLRGGGQRRVYVSSLKKGGLALHAGVSVGDVLVSINGSKDFHGKTAEKIHEDLRPPLMLVFLGFEGKLCAEVRLKQRTKQCGLSTTTRVLGSDIVEEVVFHKGSMTETVLIGVGTESSSLPRNDVSDCEAHRSELSVGRSPNGRATDEPSRGGTLLLRRSEPPCVCAPPGVSVVRKEATGTCGTAGFVKRFGGNDAVPNRFDLATSDFNVSTRSGDIISAASGICAEDTSRNGSDASRNGIVSGTANNVADGQDRSPLFLREQSYRLHKREAKMLLRNAIDRAPLHASAKGLEPAGASSVASLIDVDAVAQRPGESAAEPFSVKSRTGGISFMRI
eukprot:TRINITY_DN68107_c0_g1_i1.p1 TRINITY_DN68107_c0_g1~~TRINITY_DN68107_c0_g1_i1.p1  ORF type:complete len:520 (+),score=43.05 TRINITY_DN68107_c0_g1_i1:43-1560(+)